MFKRKGQALAMPSSSELKKSPSSSISSNTNEQLEELFFGKSKTRDTCVIDGQEVKKRTRSPVFNYLISDYDQNEVVSSKKMNLVNVKTKTLFE